MAENGLKRMNEALGKAAENRPLYCVSTTGIAGPTGGTPQKPVGLCFVAVASSDGTTQVVRLDPDSDSSTQSRQYQRDRFAETALATLLTTLA